VIGADLQAQVRAIAERYPAIFDCIDRDRVRAQQGSESGMLGRSDDFGSSALGGRGESYVAAQRMTLTRAQGISELIGLIVRRCQARSPVLVDLLGGDGLVCRVVSTLSPGDTVVVTCDASPFMVEQAWSGGIPALLQRAESPLFRDESVGSVLLAYGSHHIPPGSRASVASQAYRILQPGGVFLIHDFLPGSPVATWFSKVVDAYSVTGHDYQHYDQDQAVSYLRSAGFTDVQAVAVDDAFTVTGATRDEAELALGRYLVEMYGLVKLVDEYGAEGSFRRAFDMAGDIFRYSEPVGALSRISVRYDRDRGEWSSTMPREAVAILGVKPGGTSA
jgi:SAM-dependent methyltransferase